MTTRERLAEIAGNLWWSWNPDALSLFRRLNPDVFRAQDNNPIAALENAYHRTLQDPMFVADVEQVHDRLDAYLAEKAKQNPEEQVAYFCMEFGMHESVPLYAGGLGILAGDHLKGASDHNIPFTAVGLLLRDGYFRQSFDRSGVQQADYPAISVVDHPLQPVLDRDGEHVKVQVSLGRDVELTLIAWKMEVGRSTLYLLDADTHFNPFSRRFLTRRLYAGHRTTRIRQEIILGIGGIRLLRKLGVEPRVYHMNEGHCAFLALELLKEQLHAGMPRHEAEEYVRRHTVFTTHTPVMAGHDRFTPELFAGEMSAFAAEIGLSLEDLMAYGRVNPHDQDESFTMTILGLKLAGKANGVSRLNGEVARNQWKHMYPDQDVSDVPIGHVTNGIHVPTWTSPMAVPFLNKHIGDWQNNPNSWERIHDVPDEELWEYRSRLRAALVDYADYRVGRQTLPQRSHLDPGALTIGFARRFATYKRAPLLFHHLERTAELFADTDRPLQILFAGKAHPADTAGKEFIHEIYQIARKEPFRGKVIFLENYNMEIGRMLISGTDVWLNNPRRPYEASGTSGQKVAVHGGLNLSILDGWWPEGYDGTNGWAIGNDQGADYGDPEVQDPQDATILLDTLQNDVIPLFYDRDEVGLPIGWLKRMRSAMSTLPYQFSARRMVGDYLKEYYTPATVEEGATVGV